MKDAVYKWTELILKNWAVVVPILLFLATSTGLTFSAMDNSDKDIEIKASQEQIKNIANHYTQKKVVKSTCLSCDAFINNHIKREH